MQRLATALETCGFGWFAPLARLSSTADRNHELRDFATRVGLPLVAIGGITLENAPAVISAGADCLAVISDLFGAPDIAGRAARYQSLFEKSPA